MNHTRAFALELRTAAEVTPAMIVRAADHIDTLLDVIEAHHGAPARLPAPSSGMRTLRKWHARASILSTTAAKSSFHRAAVGALNVYFPKDDQL